MTKTLKLAGAFLALVLGSSAIAVPISGSIGFVGDYTPNNTTDLRLATSIAFGTIRTDGTANNSFSGIAENTVATVFTPLQVNQGPVGNLANTAVVLPGSAIWSVGGFALNLSSLVEDFNSSNSLILYGLGTLTGPVGFEATPGEWVATFNRSGANFTFSASSSSVPDGGASIALMGVSLLALGFMRRIFARA